MENDKLLSVKEVAARLNCSTRQCWNLLASGRLPEAVRLGRSVNWRESDIAAFIDCACDMRKYHARSA